MRHPEAGSAIAASKHALVPVINAGDGVGEHPTQVIHFLFISGVPGYFYDSRRIRNSQRPYCHNGRRFEARSHGPFPR